MKIVLVWGLLSLPLFLFGARNWANSSRPPALNSSAIESINTAEAASVFAEMPLNRADADVLESLFETKIVGALDPSEPNSSVNTPPGNTPLFPVTARVVEADEVRRGVDQLFSDISIPTTAVEQLENEAIDQLIANCQKVTDQNRIDRKNHFFTGQHFRRVREQVERFHVELVKEQGVRENRTAARNYAKETMRLLESPTRTRDDLARCVEQRGTLSLCIEAYRDHVPEERLDEIDIEYRRQAKFWSHWLGLGIRELAKQVTELNEMELRDEMQKYRAVIKDGPRPKTALEQQQIEWAIAYQRQLETELEIKSLENRLSRIDLETFLDTARKLRLKNAESVDRLSTLYYKFISDRLSLKLAPEIPATLDGVQVQELVSRGMLFRGYVVHNTNTGAYDMWSESNSNNVSKTVPEKSFYPKQISEGPRVPLQNVIAEAYHKERIKLIDAREADSRSRIIVEKMKQKCEHWQMELEQYSEQLAAPKVNLSLSREILFLNELLDHWDDLESVIHE